MPPSNKTIILIQPNATLLQTLARFTHHHKRQHTYSDGSGGVQGEIFNTRSPAHTKSKSKSRPKSEMRISGNECRILAVVNRRYRHIRGSYTPVRERSVVAAPATTIAARKKIRDRDRAWDGRWGWDSVDRKKSLMVCFRCVGPGVLGRRSGYGFPCGGLDCRVCGRFLNLWVEELERVTPGLVVKGNGRGDEGEVAEGEEEDGVDESEIDEGILVQKSWGR